MDDDVVAARIRAAFSAVQPPTSLLQPAGHARRRSLPIAIVAMASVVILAVAVLGGLSLWLNSPCPYGTGCATPPATLPAGSLTRSQAIAAALRQAPAGMSNPTVRWAVAGQNPLAKSSTTPVWLVRLTGAGLPTCAPGYLDRLPSPSDAPCLDNHLDKEPYGVVAVLDPLTGELLGWSH